MLASNSFLRFLRPNYHPVQFLVSLVQGESTAASKDQRGKGEHGEMVKKETKKKGDHQPTYTGT